MEPIKWRDKLNIDNGVIDEDHHYLVDIINKFREKVGHFESADDAVEILKELKFYTGKHFQREEELQKVARYPYLDAHHNEHIHLIKLLESLMEETGGTSGNYLNTEMGQKIGEFLRDWLIDHLIGSDLRMKPYVDKMTDHAAGMSKL